MKRSKEISKTRIREVVEYNGDTFYCTKKVGKYNYFYYGELTISSSVNSDAYYVFMLFTIRLLPG